MTTVLLMGLSKLKQIVQYLLDAGKDPLTDIAVISHATLPDQDTVVSDLSHIVEDIQRHPLSSPAVIVIGKVVRLHQQLNFFEKQPLFHAHIFLPKVGREPSALALELRESGASVHELQISERIAIHGMLRDISLKDYSYLLFTSRYAVQCFMEEMAMQKKDLRSLAHMRIAVIGKATARCLEAYGIYADLIPEEAHKEACFQMLKMHVKDADRILFPHVRGNNALAEKLRGICFVKEIAAYENRRCDHVQVSDEHIRKSDIIVFSCPSAVHCILAHVQPSQLFEKQIVSIGETTSETLRFYGITSFHQAASASYASIRDKIIDLWEVSSCIEAED